MDRIAQARRVSRMRALGQHTMTQAYSNSQLQTWKNCPLQWHFYWDLGLRLIDDEGDDHHLRYGNAIHEGLRVVYSGGTLREAQDRFLAAYPKQLSTSDQAKTRQNGIYALAQYVKRWAEDDRKWKVIAIEERSDDPWSVKPDLVIEHREQGGLWLVDHKAQPLDCNVLTPDGWLPMGRVKVGDEVIGSDGFPVKVIGIFPQGSLSSYRVTFSDGSVTRCSADHLWTGCFSHNADYYKTVTWTLDEIRERLSRNSSYQFRIPLPDMVRFRSHPLPIHPYLLGVLLGDGFIAGHTPQISVGDFDAKDILHYVQECLPATISLTKCIGNFSWSLSAGHAGVKGNNSIKQALVQLGLQGTKSATKFIPKEYLFSDIEQRKVLLQGLLDTDGCCYDGHIYFDSISLQMSNDVVDLVRSLGGYAKIRLRAGTKQQAYRVVIRFDNDVIPFRLQRKLAKRRPIQRLSGKHIVKIEYVGEQEMQCIEVAALDGLYITDDFILTHNTTGKYLNYDYWSRYEPNSQITHYLDYAQDKYGPIEGFIINAISFRFRQRASKDGPAGFWCNFERQTFNRKPEQLEYERRSRGAWIEDIERSKASGFYRTNTDSCWKCQYKPLCKAGWTWEEDRELVEIQYYQCCDALLADDEHCVLQRGHESDHSPVREVSEVEFEIEV